MTDLSADVATKTDRETNRKTKRDNDDDRKVPGQNSTLDCRYGQIGILAVAAAARYQGSAKNPAYAPASTQWRDRLAEAAA